LRVRSPNAVAREGHTHRALAYFVLPTDVIPDYLPVIGYTDDAAVLAAAVKLVASHITVDHREAARRVLARMRSEA
jgi:uncharacterized membrane protein YkvA (DUF1232 family)